MILRPESQVTYNSTGIKDVPNGTGKIIVTGSGTLASMTMNFPPNPHDRDNLVIFFSVGVTLLTIASIIPIVGSTLSMLVGSGTAMCFEYEATTNKWYKLI